MDKKKKIKSAFNALLDKSVKGDWGTLKTKLPEKNICAGLSDKPAAGQRVQKRLAWAASAAVTVIAVIAVATSLKLNQFDKVSAKQTAYSENTVITSAVQNKPSSINITAVASSTASSRQAPVKNASVSAVGGSASVMNLPAMPAEPQILNYNNKLYITRSVFNFEKTKLHNKLIGYIAFGSKVPVYSVKKEAASKSICLLSTYDQSKNYLKYNYLCDSSLKIQGKTYRITSVDYVNPVSKKSEKYHGNKSTANSYTLNWNFCCQYSFELKNVKTVLNKKIDKLSSGGTVYSIDEIKPSEAVYLNIGSNWFLLQKAHGYTGKTVDDVMKDKGITQSVIN